MGTAHTQTSKSKKKSKLDGSKERSQGCKYDETKERATVSMRHRWTSQLASLRQFERSGRPPPIISTPLKPPFISPLLGAKRIKASMVGYPDGCCFSDLHGDMWEKRVHVNECNNYGAADRVQMEPQEKVFQVVYGLGISNGSPRAQCDVPDTLLNAPGAALFFKLVSFEIEVSL
ncbi:hypothetical protein B0I74DRAFT_168154 [Yarrowia lipolytica]|nr:hypothetical protein B0I74DRAFT_168154 [Yarrowia lipolytica]